MTDPIGHPADALFSKRGERRSNVTEELSTASLKKLFRFPFSSPNWQGRFVVGAALTLAGSVVPIVPLIFVAGYVLRVMRQALAGQEPTLPEWNDWGNLTRDGLKVMLINLAYFAPALIVFVVGMGLYFAGSFYLPLAASTGGDEADAAAAFLLMMFGSIAVVFLSMALGTLFSILGAIALPMATAHFVAEGRLRAAFRVRHWWRILKADKLGYFIAWVIVAGLIGVLYVGVMLGYYTLVLCFLVPFLVAPIGFYVALVAAALFGRTYRENVAALAARRGMVENL
jgi:hypothetical protein